MNAALAHVRHRAVRRWLRARAPRGRVLDLGCGRGELAGHLVDVGWDAWGVDPADDVRRDAADRLSDRFFGGRLEDAGFVDDFFDAAILHFVLEHSRDPVSMLRSVARVLRTGGAAWIRVPNDEAARRGTPGAAFQAGLPQHRSTFTPASLAAAIRDAGLRAEEVHTPLCLAACASAPAERVPGLDPERWVYADAGSAWLARASLLAAGMALSLPASAWRAARGRGVVLHATGVKP